MSANPFLDRVFQHLPAYGGKFTYKAWSHARRPTSEGVGILPLAGVDVDKMAARIMDVGNYKGNIDYVQEGRVIKDNRPESVHFYQRIKVPVLAQIHMELTLTDYGIRDGWRVLAWHQMDAETLKLSTKQGARSEYNVGAWLLKDDRVAYALSSAPRKEDVGRLKFAALTKGADAGATQVLKNNIEGMFRWSKR